MKLISLNIEGKKHFDRVLPFLEQECPDVFCLQEVFEDDLELFTELGYEKIFLPMTLESVNENLIAIGIAIFVRGNTHTSDTFYYTPPSNELPLFSKDDIPNTIACGVIITNVCFKQTTYSIATTHFTWTPDGAYPGPAQITNMETFLSSITSLHPHVMCGDFNIPRNINPLYIPLCQHYTDAIPLRYRSSMDKNLHRLGNDVDKEIIFNSFMVDYIFTQEPYLVNDVRLQFGVSDHAAVIGHISKHT